jgi:hypothetical protein
VSGASVPLNVKLDPMEMIGSVGGVPEVVSGLSCRRGVLFAPLGYIPAVCAEIVCVPASAHSTANHHEENVQFILTLCPPTIGPWGGLASSRWPADVGHSFLIVYVEPVDHHPDGRGYGDQTDHAGAGEPYESTALTTLKMAVFAPIPRDSVRMATTVKPRLLASVRRA